MTVSLPAFLFSNINNNSNNNIQSSQHTQTPQTISPLSNRSVSNCGNYNTNFDSYSGNNNNVNTNSYTNSIYNIDNGSNNMAINTNTDAYNAGVTSSMSFGEKRIRTPHPHDVLSGRGGGINAHAGNMQFREWVRVRKNDYNLASSKTEKARVAKEVIDLVQAQNPPGRFLTKDSTTSSTSGGWWIEVDEERAMAKTAQALREGAPQIRAAHRDELEHNRALAGRKPRKRTNTQLSVQPPTLPSEYAPLPSTLASLQQKAVNDLRANVESAKKAFEMQDRAANSVTSNSRNINTDSSKRQRLSNNGAYVSPWETPATMSTASESSFDPQASVTSLALPLMLAPPPPEPQPLGSQNSSQFKRINSLALSDFSISEGWIDSGFVNPFEDEVEGVDGGIVRQRSNIHPNLYRNSSSSMSDLAGLSALFRSNESSKASARSNASGMRAINNFHHFNNSRNNGNNSSNVMLSQPGINSGRCT